MKMKKTVLVASLIFFLGMVLGCNQVQEDVETVPFDEELERSFMDEENEIEVEFIDEETEEEEMEFEEENSATLEEEVISEDDLESDTEDEESNKKD